MIIEQATAFEREQPAVLQKHFKTNRDKLKERLNQAAALLNEIDALDEEVKKLKAAAAMQSMEAYWS
jgi:Mg-chelatase subunit ChlI